MPEVLMKIILVAVGGGLGSLSRYGLAGAAQAVCGERFPVGTLLANVIGCALVGVFGYFFVDRQMLTMPHRLFLVTGFLGGLTTFSSFGYETMMFARSGDMKLAGMNIAANVVLSLAGVWAGWSGARALWG